MMKRITHKSKVSRVVTLPASSTNGRNEASEKAGDLTSDEGRNEDVLVGLQPKMPPTS